MAPVPPLRFVGELDPAAEVPRLDPGRLVPRHFQRPQEPEPAQQVHPIGALRRRRMPTRLKVPQMLRDRDDYRPRPIMESIWLPRVVGRDQRPRQRHYQGGEIPY